MANPHLGEVKFKAGEDEYTLSYSANALCELSSVLGIEFDELIARFKSNKISLTEVRTIFWQGLCDHHEGITLEETKRILKHLRGTEMGELVGKAMLLSMPESKDGDAASPQKPGEPQGGTGPASSINGATREDQRSSSGG